MKRFIPMNRRSRFLAVLLGVVAIAGVGSIAWADIPDSGVINGCYKTNNGALRVIDKSAGGKCNPSETSLNWNQKGPAGANGPTGPTGPTGPRGPSDAWYAEGNTTTTGAAVTVASVTLPAGNFTLHGSASFGSQAAAGNVNVECSFRGFTDANSDGTGAVDSASYTHENIAVDNDISLPSGGTVNWQCLSTGGGISVRGHIVAIQVATLHAVTP